MTSVDTVVVGGGQAGLAMSYHLAACGVEHAVLERSRLANAGAPSAGTPSSSSSRTG
jgi:cation diffusion facilitator CzcD-associated flavoprotein CzcO